MALIPLKGDSIHLKFSMRGQKKGNLLNAGDFLIGMTA